MNTTHLFRLPEELPPKTAMALFDLLSELTDALWQQYEPQLLELAIEELDDCPDSQQALDFDDDLPF